MEEDLAWVHPVCHVEPAVGEPFIGFQGSWIKIFSLVKIRSCGCRVNQRFSFVKMNSNFEWSCKSTSCSLGCGSSGVRIKNSPTHTGGGRDSSGTSNWWLKVCNFNVVTIGRVRGLSCQACARCSWGRLGVCTIRAGAKAIGGSYLGRGCGGNLRW